MKSTVKLKLGNEWKCSGLSMFRTTKFNTEKALKFLKDSFKAQGLTPVVSYEADYVMVTA
jgi:hypothetical protein